MNLFRSEEHIARWLGGRAPGATISVSKLSELSHAWWGDRFSPTWRPHTREQNAAILERLGLTGEFWRLPQMIDRQFPPLRMGACARRNRARLDRCQGPPALPPIESTTLLGADPPRSNANHRSTI